MLWALMCICLVVKETRTKPAIDTKQKSNNIGEKIVMTFWSCIVDLEKETFSQTPDRLSSATDLALNKKTVTPVSFWEN